MNVDIISISPSIVISDVACRPPPLYHLHPYPPIPTCHHVFCSGLILVFLSFASHPVDNVPTDG